MANPGVFQSMSDYERIASAIAYISERAVDQPALDDIAAHVHLSPFHFQRLFRRWAGTTPKRFLQALTLESGKHLLAGSGSVLEVSDSLGLSGSSRLHDHFVDLDAVTPGEYKRKGQGLTIEYGVHETPFGYVFVAMTGRGVCRMDFLDRENSPEPLINLRKAWPLSSLVESRASTLPPVETMLAGNQAPQQRIPLHVRGTNFQVAVWRALLRIPPGSAVSYSQIASALGCPGSARAVGNAVGANPVAFLIPCHRVIQQSGALGGYRWGQPRKQAIQVWERVQAR